MSVEAPLSSAPAAPAAPSRLTALLRRSHALPLALGATLLTWSMVTLGRRLMRQMNTSGAAELWPHKWLLHGLIRWDSGWYAGIALDGYWYRPGEQCPVAFFPGYPMAVRFMSWLLGVHPFMGGVVVSSVCGVLAVMLFHAWAREVAGPEHALPAAWTLVLYPYAFYLFGVMYTESFFLTCALAAFLCLERGQRGGAALFGALATFTRPVAPAVLVGLLVRHWELKRRRGERLGPSDAVLLLAGAGMAAYVGYLWWAFGEPLAFAKVQAVQGWDHVPGWPTWLKFKWFELMAGNARPGHKLQFLVHALAAVVPLCFVWPMRRTLGWGYALYVAGVVGLPAVAMKDFWGMGRYALAAFPCFLFVSLALETRPRLRRVLAVVSLYGFCALATQFGRGSWVA